MMRNRNIKQRITALGLAMLMGVSSLGSAPVFAAEETKEASVAAETAAANAGTQERATAEDFP